MSSDEEVQVKFRAVIGDFLSGLKEATDNVKASTTGMQGDVGALAETIGKMGATAVVLGGVGLAFEGIKKATEFIVDATRETNELADAFEDLGYATGASLEDLNTFTVAIELSGGKVGDLTGLLVGMQRGIKANSEYLIANGVAANRAALEGMSFEEYLRKVHEIAERMATPTERAQFLIEAMGRSGTTSGNQIKELVENLDQAREITEKNNIITRQSMEQANATEESIGRLKAAQQAYAASVSANATPIMNWWRDFRTEVYNSRTEHEQLTQMAHTGFIKMDVDQVHEEEGWKRMRAEADAYYKRISEGVKEALASSKDYMDVGVRNAPASDKIHPKQPDKPPAKKVDSSTSRSDSHSDEIAERQKALNYINQMEANAQKERVAMARVSANAETEAEKYGLDLQKLNLEQAVQAGLITRKQELVELKKIREQELQVDLEAVQKELGIYQGNLAGWKKLQDQMVALKRKAAMDIKKIDADMATDQVQQIRLQQGQYQQFFGAISSGFGNVVDSMIVGQQSFSQTMEQLERQALANLAKSALTYIGNQAAKAAAGAAASAAESGPTGWAIAIPVAMSVLAAVMGLQGQVASAARGFDIPAGMNPLTQLHEKEMVLPEEEANTIRGLKNREGGSRGGDHYHFHMMDTRGAEGFVKRNQGLFIGAANEARLNRRKS